MMWYTYHKPFTLLNYDLCLNKNVYNITYVNMTILILDNCPTNLDKCVGNSAVYSINTTRKALSLFTRNSDIIKILWKLVNNKKIQKKWLNCSAYIAHIVRKHEQIDQWFATRQNIGAVSIHNIILRKLISPHYTNTCTLQ